MFGLQLSKTERRNFMVEIDRGTMPVRRSDPEQTSFEGKMRVYLAAHAAKQHERQFGWTSFRVLTVTINRNRMQTMQVASRQIQIRGGPGPSLFLFTTFADLESTTPIDFAWQDGAADPPT